MGLPPLAGRCFALLALASAACVSPPKPADWLAIGFRTPEQTLRTFQTAVRADEPLLEYRCFSSAFLARNRISQPAWRELRDQLWGTTGARWAVAHAELPQAARIVGDQAELTLAVLGHRRVVRLVREDFAELWSGDRRILDDRADFSSSTGVQEHGEKRWIYAQVELPKGHERSEVSELVLGREWKIDDISALDLP